MKKFLVLITLFCLQASMFAQTSLYIDSLRVYGDKSHVQGIVYDKIGQCFYCSFTTAFCKVDLDGNIVGTIDKIHGHLGAMTFDEKSRKVYASLECKDDAIGKSISKGMGLESYSHNDSRFYIAEIDVDSLTMVQHELPIVREDYLAGNFACSGIDGITIAPAFGSKNKDRRFIYVAYGIYGDVNRTDNDCNILLCYKPGYFDKPLHRYFIRTGNTTWGVQNLCYDPWTDKMFMAVYKGKKPQWPNYSFFVVDMDQKPHLHRISGEAPYQKTRVPVLSRFCGSMTSLGSTGMYSLGDGYLYVGKSGSENGRQFCDFILYCVSDDPENPLQRAR